MACEVPWWTEQESSQEERSTPVDYVHTPGKRNKKMLRSLFLLAHDISILQVVRLMLILLQILLYLGREPLSWPYCADRENNAKPLGCVGLSQVWDIIFRTALILYHPRRSCTISDLAHLSSAWLTLQYRRGYYIIQHQIHFTLIQPLRLALSSPSQPSSH